MTWQFTRFGLSTSTEKNRCEVIEPGRQVRLYSAVYDEKGVVTGKGGKFMPFFDGISFYYTAIPASQPYFSLEASIRVDFLNPNLDGQEGFALLLRDSLGLPDDNTDCYMANSAAVLASSFPDEHDRAVRDCLGYRFVWDLSPDHVAQNVRGAGQSVALPFDLAQPLKIREGESYRVRLWRDEAGFHVAYLGDESRQAHFPEPERMLRLNNKEWYLGFAAARGCNITVDDIQLHLGDTEEAATPTRWPLPQPRMKVEFLTPHAPAGMPFSLGFLSRTSGQIEVLASDGEVLAACEAVAGRVTYCPAITFAPGEYLLRYRFVSHETILEGDGVLTAKALRYAEPGLLYTAPAGRADAKGTPEEPYDLQTALHYSVPGDRIILAPEVYAIDSELTVHYANSGTQRLPKTLHCPEGEATIDFQGQGGPFLLKGDYWQISGLRICHSRGDRQGMKIAGSGNRLHHVWLESNGDTGLQIASREDLDPRDWPRDNQIRFCVASDNADPGLNNADGFAAKLACGEGNRFLGCISYNNIDDGFDLYNRISNGPIGRVLIEHSLCFSNGHNLANTMQADGNGFKLGGEGIPIPHLLRKSLALSNDADGITSNSNPAVLIEDCVAIKQGGSNYAIYGQGSDASAARLHNCISIDGAEADRLSGQIVAELAAGTDVFFLAWFRELLALWPEEENWLRFVVAKMCVESMSSELYENICKEFCTNA